MTRFRRTRDELARGLTPEQAQAERGVQPLTKALDDIVKLPKPVKLIKAKENGQFFISIFPAKGVDKDYFEHIKARVEVTLDNDFYKWVDHYLDKVYGGDASKLFQDILDKGIGQVIDTVHLEKDIE
jgi:hypothetical protein